MAESDSQSFFKGGPSLQQMGRDKKYNKTLRFYRGAIRDQLMIMPQDLEEYPAPVLCPFCEVPVITRAKTERSGKQMYRPHPVNTAGSVHFRETASGSSNKVTS